MNYRTLLRGYRYAGNLDFTRNRRQIMIVLKLAVALTVLPLAIGLIVSPPRPSLRGFLATWYLWPATAGMLVAYIPLHELTHGAVMFALSGVRPSFGIKLPYAYAGSTAWFDRKSHVVTALAPLILWSAILQLLIAALPGRWFWPLWITHISNLSGSAGDIYCAWALVKMEGRLLIQDTGTHMRVMRYVDQ